VGREAGRANLNAAVEDPVEDEVGALPQQLTPLLRRRAAPPSSLPPSKLHASSPRCRPSPPSAPQSPHRGISAFPASVRDPPCSKPRSPRGRRPPCSKPRIHRSSSRRIECRLASPVREGRSTGRPRSPCLSPPTLDPCVGGRERAGAWGGSGRHSTPTDWPAARGGGACAAPLKEGRNR
jgi:hypothetical protein